MKKQKKTVICHRCSKCCNYICIEFDRPNERNDFEDLAWMLAHHDVCIRVEGKEWYLLVKTPCRYLNAEGYCDIYDERPKICRRYTPGSCDFESKENEKDDDADHVFWTLDELRKYRDENFPLKKKKRKKTGGKKKKTRSR